MTQKYSTHQGSKPSCVVGFDGFTDSIISVVKERESVDSFAPMTHIAELGNTILEAASVSCNIELVTKQKKIGGNAPILANALLKQGHLVTFIGAIGQDNHVEPLFQEMASRCKKVISLTPSGLTDALEFSDGKVLLGKHESLIHINYEMLLNHVSKTELVNILDSATLFVSANWTMLPMMNSLWAGLQRDVLPNLSKKERFFFVDLADPKKRTDKDLKEALSLLSNWGISHKVILGLNAGESVRVASLYKIKGEVIDIKSALKTAKELLTNLKLHALLIHTKRFAVVSTNSEESSLESPFCENPLITTGAGDNFNAGFCSGLLQYLPLKDCLSLAIKTAGFYIRNAQSPTPQDLELTPKS